MSRLLFAITLAASTILDASGNAGIKGHIRDETGAAIGKATVIVVREHSTVSILTNEDGGFALAVMPQGLYDVFVSATGFAPTCAKLYVEANHWTAFDCTLKVDPLGLKLYGDTFDWKPPQSKKR